jgi:sugar lactone lactonase YvrE
VTPQGVVTLWVGDPKLGRSIDGIRTKARFCLLETFMLTPEGDFYVSDNGVLRKVSPAGDVFRLAGGVYSGSLPLKGSATTKPQIKALAKEEQWAANDTLDGLAAKGICMDAKGNLYVADIGRSVILKFSTEGKVSVIAGKENDPGPDDGSMGTARFMSPTRLVIDAEGNLYVTELHARTIRKVDRAGVVTTIGGSPGKTGYTEGGGNVARFTQPIGIAVTSKGILYVADGASNRIVIGTPIGK